MNPSELSLLVFLGTTVRPLSLCSFHLHRAHASVFFFVLSTFLPPQHHCSTPAFHNSLSQISAALFSGNALVLKCSEQVAWSSNFFVDVVRTCLAEHGFDPEVLQLVICYPEDAAALTEHEKIRHITCESAFARRVFPLTFLSSRFPSSVVSISHRKRASRSKGTLNSFLFRFSTRLRLDLITPPAFLPRLCSGRSLRH